MYSKTTHQCTGELFRAADICLLHSQYWTLRNALAPKRENFKLLYPERFTVIDAYKHLLNSAAPHNSLVCPHILWCILGEPETHAPTPTHTHVHTTASCFTYNSISFTCAGTRCQLVTVSLDGNMILWDPADGTCMKVTALTVCILYVYAHNTGELQVGNAFHNRLHHLPCSKDVE